MYLKALLCVPLILAGCTQYDGALSTPKSFDEFAYDARDAIPNDVPLPDPRSGQRPVVGVKKFLVSVIHWQDGDALNDSLIQHHTVSSDPDSLRSYILAASGGKLTLDGRMISYKSGPRPDMCKSGSPMPISLATSEGEKAARASGLDPASFDYLINVIDCGGYASAYMPGRIMGVYGQAGSPHVYKHELGHNLGYNHGYTYTQCSKEGNVVHAPAGCKTVLYGDSGDSVSGGGTLYPANNRWYSGWLDTSQAAVIGRTGLYRLGVLGRAGPQLYLIDRPGLAPAQIALEYRKPTPYDKFPVSDNRVNGVWVRYTNMAGSLLNTQVDGTPETASTADPTLLPGKILKDETAGITVKVCSTSSDGATIAVSVKNEAMPGCVPPPPYIGNPGNAYNPISFSGMGSPGAEIFLSCKYQGHETKLNTRVETTGEWRVAAPYLQLGYYTCEARQRVVNITSEARVITFNVR